MTDTSQVLVVPRPVPAARQRLVCFPHAGGGASFYRNWMEVLDPAVELQIVQYPGHETRIAEPLVADVAELAGQLADAVGATGHRWSGTAFFGHSMGAIVAHETALLLQERGGVHLTGLVLSGRSAPRPKPGPAPPVRSDEDIIGIVKKHGSTPMEIFDDPELREVVLELLRNDYLMVDAYGTPGSRARGLTGRLAVDLTVLSGDRDDGVDVADLDRWRDATAGRYRCEVFGGGHFYLVPHRDRVVGLIGALVRGAGGIGATAGRGAG